MDLMSILNQAGGVGAIAQQLGVDPATVERGAGALLPHVQNGVDSQGLPDVAAEVPAEQGSGLGGMLGGLLGGGGAGGILGSLVGGGVGNQVLGQIFGSKDASREVATQASQQSGVDPSILRKLLPIVAGAVAMHYITRGRGGGQGQQDQGGGGVLGSILGGLGR